MLSSTVNHRKADQHCPVIRSHREQWWTPGRWQSWRPHRLQRRLLYWQRWICCGAKRLLQRNRPGGLRHRYIPSVGHAFHHCISNLFKSLQAMSHRCTNQVRCSSIAGPLVLKHVSDSLVFWIRAARRVGYCSQSQQGGGCSASGSCNCQGP